MLSKSSRHSLFLGLLIATGSQFVSAQENNNQEETNTNETVKVEIVADAVPANESLGKTVISKQQINDLGTGNNSINDIAYTSTNVQFLETYNTLSEKSVLDIRPSKISISGGEPYENNFIVDGIRTNSLHDDSSQNRKNNLNTVSTLVGHPQTVFVNPAMVESVTVYDSNVPAKYGHFTGGVFEVETKDPSGEFHTGTMFGFETDEMTKYILVAPKDYDPEEDEEAKPEFLKYQVSAYVDTPITKNTAAIFEYSRQVSELKNQQAHRSYYDGTRSTHSMTENFKVKTKTWLNENSTFKFTSLYTPSDMRSIENNLVTQKNEAWQNSIEFNRDTDNSSLEIKAAYQISDMGRESDPVYYRYAVTDSTRWGSSTAKNSNLGGWGDLDAKEKQLPITADYTYNLTDTAKINIGAEYVYEYAQTERPETLYSYGRYIVSDLVVSADGEDDPTVIDGEQAFTRRTVREAYNAEASINNYGAWAEFSDEYSFLGTKFSYRIGTRFDYEDYLENANLAPRLVVTWTPKKWVDITVGWNRYYAGNYLAYALKEQEPGYTRETRSYTEIDGQYVFSSDDWETSYVSSLPKYSQANVDTPYNDEFTLATTFHSSWGDLRLQYLDRNGHDKFARSAKETVEEDGVTYKTYYITNNGSSDYESYSFKWNYQWENHTFELNGTLSETQTTNADPFEEFLEEDLLVDVYYQDEIITFEELAQERAGYGSSDYFNVIWTSNWLKNRLSFTLSGRLDLPYDSIRKNGTIKVDGTKYSFYEDYRTSKRLTMNLNTTWVAYDSADLGTVKVYLKLRNIFNDHSDSGDIESDSDDTYYEEGRSVWVGLSYDF